LNLSLSLDNILVIALVFAAFRVPAAWQHRLLFCGRSRGAGHARSDDRVGVALIHEFRLGAVSSSARSWFLPGIKMIFSRQETLRPEKNPMHPDGAQILSRSRRITTARNF
jgi:tellurite resistance protein TerC